MSSGRYGHVAGTGDPGNERDRGFTIVELIVALLVMAIVMAALAPTFYGDLRSTVSTNDRSVANGLAVAATEQMRSFPYWQIGYTSADYTSTAGACLAKANGGSAPAWNSSANTYAAVTLPSGVTSALDKLPSTP